MRCKYVDWLQLIQDTDHCQGDDDQDDDDDSGF